VFPLHILLEIQQRRVLKVKYRECAQYRVADTVFERIAALPMAK